MSESSKRSYGTTELVDPDPLSAFIIALGAVGSIASIYTVVDDKVLSKHREERRANCNAIRDSITAIETSVNELRGYLKSLEILFLSSAESTRNSNSKNPMMALAQFGSVRLLFTRTGHDRWREIEEGIIESGSRVTKHVNELVRHFSVTPIAFDGKVVSRLQEVTDLMNRCLGGLRDMHFERLFGEMERVTNECMSALAKLRVAVYENCR